MDVQTTFRVSVEVANLDDSTSTLSVSEWHHHDDDIDFQDVNVYLKLRDLPWSGAVNMTHWRVDEGHSNTYATWLEMGSPQADNITQEQHDGLVAAGTLAMLEEPKMMNNSDGCAEMDFDLPIKSLSLLQLRHA